MYKMVSNFCGVLPSYGSACVPDPGCPSVRTAIQMSCVGEEAGVAVGSGIFSSAETVSAARARKKNAIKKLKLKTDLNIKVGIAGL